MNNMKKNLKIGNFLLPEKESEPVILFIFNEYESDIENVTYSQNNGVIDLKYPSGNVLGIDIEDENVLNRISINEKFLIIEVEDNDGNVSAIYEATLKQ